MKFELPKASRERMDELLSYLEQPCEYYNGNRADDFKECFDINSEWCWKYADIMLRGMKTRKLDYGERHHIVPFAWFRRKGYKEGSRYARKCATNNMTVLTYGEHLVAHYCAVQCAVDNMIGSMADAFCTMFNVKGKGRHIVLPGEDELIASIPNLEYNRIRSMRTIVCEVEKSGRPHHWEVSPTEYTRAWREANLERIRQQEKKYAETHKEERKLSKKRHYKENKSVVIAKQKEYYEANKPVIRERRKKHYAANKDELLAAHRKYYAENRETLCKQKHEYHQRNKSVISIKQKEYRNNHKEKLQAYQEEYRKNNKSKISAKNKAWYEANKEIKLAKDKIYRKKNHSRILERYKIYNQDHADVRKAYREANKDKLKSKYKEYYESHKEQKKVQDHVRWETKKEELLAKHKVWANKNKAHLAQYAKNKYAAKIAAGYSYRKDPITGKRKWIFVGKAEDLDSAK